MLGNFTYCNPTKLYFGENALSFLQAELNKYGNNIMLCYGGGSIKKNGIYEQVVSVLNAVTKTLSRTAALCPTPPLKNCTKARKSQKKTRSI